MRTALTPEGDWRDRAACAGTDGEMFFAEDGEGIDRAVDVCRACPVKRDCLTYALDNHIRAGIWGGITERQRIRGRRTPVADVAPTPRNRAWTPDDDERVRELLAARRVPRQIAADLGRTLNSVQHRIARIRQSANEAAA